MEFEMLQKVIVEVLNVDMSEVNSDTRFKEDLGADSLDIYQIVLGIEEAFDIEISEEDAQTINTVGAAFSFIQNARD